MPAKGTGSQPSLPDGHFSGNGLEVTCLNAIVPDPASRQRLWFCYADIGLLVWAPQGNRQDLKVLRAGEEIWGSDFPRLPLVTTTFNTGYIEAASILVSLAATLAALATPGGTSPCGLQTPDLLWPQRTGLPELDGRTLAQLPEYLLALASTDLGYNFAAVFRRGWKP